MRITSVDLPENYRNLGLKRIRMSRLGGVVVLAGANGSGKSRLLGAIRVVSKRTLTGDALASVSQEAARIRSKVNELESRKASGEQFDEDGAPVHIQLGPRRQRLSRLEDSLEPHRLVGVTEDWRPGCVLPYVPKATRSLNGYRERSLARLDMEADAVSELGVDRLEQRAIPYVRRVLARWLRATHQDIARSPEDVLFIEEFERLQDIVAALLGEGIKPADDGEPGLFGQSLARDHLSEGQTALLQVAVLLHAQGKHLGDLVLLLDEPESHLHPSAMIEVLERLRAANPHGQIWIATHSLPLLAWAPLESIWYMDDAGVSWAGRRPERVLQGLLGEPDQRALVEEFLRLPAQLASLRFSWECLLPPGVVDTPVEDRQLQQIRAVVESKLDGQGALRVLDFGAGKGRLLHALREMTSAEQPLDDVIDYIAFDPSPDNADACKAVIEEIYGTSDDRYFETLEDVQAALDEDSVHVAVMCNVLHEIPPAEWKNVLGMDSALAYLLQSDGALLVVEDQHIPTGEKAHRQGFLLLDEPHLATLFDRREADPPIDVREEGGGRLKAHLLPAALLGRVDGESTKKALKMLKKTAFRTVRQLREMEPSTRNGQLHGLWSQLYTNADLALRDLGIS